MRQIIMALSLLLVASDALAKEAEVTLKVSGMYCPVCPITVRKALEKVDGVQQVSINYDAQTAIVTFDDSKVDIPTLTQATKAAGYPSTVQGK